MPFVNPYNFVRSDKPMPRREATKSHRPVGYSGTLTCRLENHSPIFTAWGDQPRDPRDPDLKRFFRINGRLALPSTSLKGMLRNLAEAISNGCGPFDREPHRRCRSPRSLCPNCRIFGFIDTTPQRGGDDNSQNRVHTGQVSVSDAFAEDDWELGEGLWLKELSSPKPDRHLSFYEEAARQRGRKYYYHHQHVRSIEDIPQESHSNGRNVKIEPLLRGVFTFQMRYWDLDRVELGLLLHSIELPQSLYHKFGMGKPLGLGTVRIDITGWQEADLDPVARYRQFDLATTTISLAGKEGPGLDAEKQRLQEHIQSFKSVYAREYACLLEGNQPDTDNLWELDAANLKDLQIILSQVPYSREIHYPSYGWFREHGGEKLPTIQETHAGPDHWLPD